MTNETRRRTLRFAVLLVLVAWSAFFAYSLGGDVFQTRTLTTTAGEGTVSEVTKTCRPARLSDPAVVLPGLAAVLFSWAVVKRAAGILGWSSKG